MNKNLLFIDHTIDQPDKQVRQLLSINALLAILLIVVASFRIDKDIKEIGEDTNRVLTFAVGICSAAIGFLKTIKNQELNQNDYRFYYNLTIGMLLTATMLLTMGLSEAIPPMIKRTPPPMSQVEVFTTLKEEAVAFKQQKISDDDVYYHIEASLSRLNQFTSNTLVHLLDSNGIAPKERWQYSRGRDSIIALLTDTLNTHHRRGDSLIIAIKQVLDSHSTLELDAFCYKNPLLCQAKVIADENGQKKDRGLLKDYLRDLMDGVLLSPYQSIRPLPYRDGQLVMNEIIIIEQQ